VAPLNRRAQRLVPGRSAARAREQLERPGQTPCDRFQTHRADPRGGQLESERNAVQVVADRRHRGHVRGAERKPRMRRPGPGQEQRRSLEILQLLQRWQMLWPREGQRRHPPGDLARHAQALPARRQHRHLRAAAEQVGGKRRTSLPQMLAVVQHEQPLLRSKHRGKPVDGRRSGAFFDAERRSDRPRQQHRSGHGAQVDQINSVRERRAHGYGSLDRQPGLTDAARADQRDQPPGQHQSGNLGELALPADERRQGRRHAARPVPQRTRDPVTHDSLRHGDAPLPQNWSSSPRSGQVARVPTGCPRAETRAEWSGAGLRLRSSAQRTRPLAARHGPSAERAGGPGVGARRATAVPQIRTSGTPFPRSTPRASGPTVTRVACTPCNRLPADRADRRHQPALRLHPKPIHLQPGHPRTRLLHRSS
jgi:hypothetical protein